MSRQEILVTFDPSKTSEAPFTFLPERAVLDERTAVVDVILRTEGEGGAVARFAEPEAIRWKANGPSDLQEEFNGGRTTLTLRGFPMNEAQGSIDYGYVVHVEYQGTMFSSTAQYPVMSCVQTGGG